jgi:hypothetical protein
MAFLILLMAPFKRVALRLASLQFRAGKKAVLLLLDNHACLASHILSLTFSDAPTGNFKEQVQALG